MIPKSKQAHLNENFKTGASDQDSDTEVKTGAILYVF